MHEKDDKPKLILPRGYKPPPAVKAALDQFRDVISRTATNQGFKIQEIHIDRDSEINFHAGYVHDTVHGSLRTLATKANVEGLNTFVGSNIRTVVGAIRGGNDLEGVVLHEIEHLKSKDVVYSNQCDEIAGLYANCDDIVKQFHQSPGLFDEEHMDSGRAEKFLERVTNIKVALENAKKIESTAWLFSSSPAQLANTFSDAGEGKYKSACELLDDLPDAPTIEKLGVPLRRLIEHYSLAYPPDKRKKEECVISSNVEQAIAILSELGTHKDSWINFASTFHQAREFVNDEPSVIAGNNPESLIGLFNEPTFREFELSQPKPDGPQFITHPPTKERIERLIRMNNTVTSEPGNSTNTHPRKKKNDSPAR